MHKTDYVLSQAARYVELVVYSVVAFFVPFLLSHPQLLVGTLVNASLVLAGLNLKNMKLLPVILLPSIAVLTRGAIFGPFTVFLLYMIPFIWIGNSLLVGSMKINIRTVNNISLNQWLRLLIGICAKTIFLALSAFILIKLNIIPELFMTTMGIMQVYTAVAGGVLALGIHHVKKKFTMKLSI
ncbi:MAG: hypothetical protein KKA43_06375 [Nanoarchaeota archaeon]|nr:hypothetical protein [Nanoarchaeota archaeon]